MKKIIIITGQTGTGKSDFAIEIAKQFNGEIISADSVQIYKGLDIGSAKLTKKQQQGIKHHLIDIIGPESNYSVGQFVQDVAAVVDEIEGRQKIAIIAGGTMLYIKALIEGFDFGGTDADINLRNSLNALAEKKGRKAVWEKLNELSPEMAVKVHCNNLKRIIRYIEITKNSNAAKNNVFVLKDYKVLTIALVQDRKLLYPRLNKRVDDMIENGLVNEVKNLLNNGAKKDCQAFNSIGYKEILSFLNNEIIFSNCVELIKQHTRNYAKRQLTFLKTMKDINYFDIENIDKAKLKVIEFMKGEYNEF